MPILIYQQTLVKKHVAPNCQANDPYIRKREGDHFVADLKSSMKNSEFGWPSYEELTTYNFSVQINSNFKINANQFQFPIISKYSPAVIPIIPRNMPIPIIPVQFN